MTPDGRAGMLRENGLLHVERALLVGIGGFAGANLRYFFELVLPSTPGAILVVNVAGCFGIAALLYWSHVTAVFSAESRLVFGVGLLASFTTYSTFAVILVEGTLGFAVGYAIGTYAFGILGVLAGRRAARGVGVWSGWE